MNEQWGPARPGYSTTTAEFDCQVVIPRTTSHRSGRVRAERKNFNGDSTIHTVPLQEKNPLTNGLQLFRFNLLHSTDRL